MKSLSHDSAELPVSVVITEEEEQQARGLLRAFIALRHRNFRLFWVGQLISLIGTWMQTTAQAWLVLELTHSAWWLGVVGALQFLPVLLLALFGGVLADRLPKRTVLLFTQSSSMLLAFILWILVATGGVHLWNVLILASLLGLTNALLFLLNGISFIAVIIGLSMIDMHQLHAQVRREALQHGTRRPGTLKSLREGLAYVRNTPSVLLVIAVVGIVSLFGINFNVVLPLFATDVLHAGPAGFGLISATFGLGSLLSALWLAWGNNRPSISRLLSGTIAFGILEALFALSHLYLLSLVLIAGVGFAQIAFSALANTTLQTVTPDHLRGRVMSVYMMVFAGSTPLGNLFIGGLALLYNAPIALLIGAMLSLIAAVTCWILRKPAEKSLAESSFID